MLVFGRKAVGILVESGARPDGRLWLAVGIGINLAHAPTDIERPATSFAEHMAGPPPRPEDAVEILAARFEVLAQALGDAGLCADRRPAGPRAPMAWANAARRACPTARFPASPRAWTRTARCGFGWTTARWSA